MTTPRGVVASAVFIATIASLSSLCAQAPLGPTGSWDLTFQDNFDGTTLDGSKWKLGQQLQFVNGSGATTPKAVTVSGGVLKITALNETTTFGASTKSFGTAEISTYRNFRQANGFFECRMRYNQTTGLWPAFWTMPDRGSYGYAGYHNRSFIKFNLVGATPTVPATVTSAILKLTLKARESGDFNVNICKTSDAWSESTLTWANKPIADPLYINSIFYLAANAPAVNTEISVDITNYVKSQVEGSGDDIVSLALVDFFEKQQLIQFYSSEATNVAYRPRLVINSSNSYYATEDGDTSEIAPTSNYGATENLRIKQPWAGSNTSTFTNGMEIDIMETLGVWGPQVSHALHWDGYDYGTSDVTKDHEATGAPSHSAISADSSLYHVYGLNWKTDALDFYVDGVKVWTYTNALDNSSGIKTGEIPTAAGFILLSLQLGGWSGSGNTAVGTVIGGKTMEVDYVRVWTPGTGGSGGVQVIVDNMAGPPAVPSTTGWSTSPAAGYYGSNSHSTNSPSATKNFSFRPQLTHTGGPTQNYDVYLWWPNGQNHFGANVPVEIIPNASTGSVAATIMVNQLYGTGNGWFKLGSTSYPLTNTPEVKIRTQSVGGVNASGYVMADAVKFVPIP